MQLLFGRACKPVYSSFDGLACFGEGCMAGLWLVPMKLNNLGEMPDEED